MMKFLLCFEQYLTLLASPSKFVDVGKMTLDFAIAVISRVAFGMRFSENLIGKEKFERIFNESQLVLSNFYFADFFPLLGWIDRLSGRKATLDRSFHDLDVLYQELIDEHLKPDRRDYVNLTKMTSLTSFCMNLITTVSPLL